MLSNVCFPHIGGNWMTTRHIFTTLALLAGAAVSHAELKSALATFNVTVQPAGPRQGNNGKNFLNVEGSVNNAFASYGVVDFTTAGLFGSTLNDITKISLRLVASNAAFSFTGDANVYITEDTATNATQTGSPLIFDATQLPEGLGTQLSPNTAVGVIKYKKTLPTGTEYWVDFTPTGALKTYLLAQINAGGTVRFAVTPTTDTTAATFAGFSNTNVLTPGPTIYIDGAAAGAAKISGRLLNPDLGVNGPDYTTVEFRDPNDLGTVLYTANHVAIDANGNWATTDLPAAGTYNVSVFRKPYLRKSFGNINIASSVNVGTATLVSGDIDHDNSVTVFDYGVLSDYFDKTDVDTDWGTVGANGFAPVEADIDFDGGVTVFDYGIISTNFDKSGND